MESGRFRLIHNNVLHAKPTSEIETDRPNTLADSVSCVDGGFMGCHVDDHPTVDTDHNNDSRRTISAPGNSGSTQLRTQRNTAPFEFPTSPTVSYGLVVATDIGVNLAGLAGRKSHPMDDDNLSRVAESVPTTINPINDFRKLPVPDGNLDRNLVPKN